MTTQTHPTKEEIQLMVKNLFSNLDYTIVEDENKQHFKHSFGEYTNHVENFEEEFQRSVGYAKRSYLMLFGYEPRTFRYKLSSLKHNHNQNNSVSLRIFFEFEK